MNNTDSNSKIEELIDAVIHCSENPEHDAGTLQSMVDQVHAFDCSEKRIVLLGGGTGLSTVVGGNSQLAQWPDNPHIGLKQLFPHLDVIVCTTDDGRSTGKLLQQLPMIGIGDIRKLSLSMIVSGRLESKYRLDSKQCRDLVRLIYTVFNHRFDNETVKAPEIADPLLAAPPELRAVCPDAFKDILHNLGAYLTTDSAIPHIVPGGHCLGNLLLTASIFQASGAGFERPPSIAAMRRGIDRICEAIGVPKGRLHPATAAPGQLVFHYAHGVATHGQSKTSTARRGFPIERVYIEFYKKPTINEHAISALKDADIIILAPGSLYTSSMPVLLVPSVAEAIRGNTHALKILAANFWVEKGETDITHTDRRRGFRVSELLDAYERNIFGGRNDLFDCVLSANLDTIPASILRNYAFEGKRPLYLDRTHVENMDIKPVESGISAVEQIQTAGRIYHDPRNFALAVHTLLYAHSLEPVKLIRKNHQSDKTTETAQEPVLRSKQLLCDYWASINAALESCLFENEILRTTLLQLVWKNRDIRLEHVQCFKAARVIAAQDWNRSTDWDNVLGYYDPHDNCCKFHSQLLDDPQRLAGNMLIVLGESLLGSYIKKRSWTEHNYPDVWGSRCYEIKLLTTDKRTCILKPEELHEYLVLSRMVPHPTARGTYRITLNNDDGFIPPGLLFGLMYAWYLDNSYAPVIENEMAILHLQEKTLIPHQVQEFKKKKALIDFFRKKVFKIDI